MSKFDDYEPLDLNLRTDTGSSFILYGSSKQGKTTCMRWLYMKYFRNYVTILCAPNINSSIYDEFRDKCIITPYFHTLVELVKTIYMIQNKTDNRFKFLVIIDDNVTHKNDNILKELFLSFRNSHISSICCIQAQTLINKNIRMSVNYGIFFRYLSPEGCMDVVDRYVSAILPGKNKTVKAEAYDELTKDHHFILWDQLNNHHVVSKLPDNLI